MKTKLVKIGNSRGIRLPKAVIEQAGLRENEIELIVRDDEIVLRSPSRRKRDPRAGWDEAFRRAIAKHGPPESIDADWELMPNDFDEKEWTW